MPAEIVRVLDGGTHLAALVQEFAAAPCELGDELLVEAVAAAKRVEAWAAANAAALAAVLSRRDVMTTHPRDGGTPDVAIQAAATELAMRLGISRWQGKQLVTAGRAMFEDGPLGQTGEALSDGELSWSKACTIVGGLSEVAAPVAWAVQEKVLPGAPRRTVRQLEKDIADALITVDPADADARHARAKATRRVTRPKALADGMAKLTAVLPAQDAACVDLALHAAAKAARADGDSRTTDQIRADALTTLAVTALNTGWIGQPPTAEHQGVATAPTPSTGQASTRGGGATRPSTTPSAGSPADAGGASGAGEAPTTSGTASDTGDAASGPTCQTQARFIPVPLDAPGHDHRPAVSDLPGTGPRPPMRLSSGRLQVNITVPLHVLLPDPKGPPPPTLPWESPPPETTGARAAVLHGIGPVPDCVARALAAGGRWRRLVTDPRTDTVLDVGRQTYAPPEPIARHVRARDQHCVRPGCTVPAEQCELDHTIAYASGGTTADHNLGPLCLADHRLKSAGTFHVIQPYPGVFQWDTPAGLRYRRNLDGTHTILPTPPQPTPFEETYPPRG